MATRGAESSPGDDRLHSVRRSLAVLEALAGRPGGATPKELSQALGLHLSTCYRLLNTLVASGYAARSSSSGLFRLGRRIAYLHHGYVAGLRPPMKVLAFLHALQVATGETAMLFQLDGDDAVATAIVPGSRPASYPPGYVGLAAPAYTVAVGRVLLAWLPTAQIDAYLARCTAAPESPWFPPANPGALRSELRQIRLDGYALDRGEGHPDVGCVAAPIIDRSGVAGAICTLAPSSRLRRDESATVAVILEIARAIGAMQTALPARNERAAGGDEDEKAVSQTAIASALATIAEAMSRVG